MDFYLILHSQANHLNTSSLPCLSAFLYLPSGVKFSFNLLQFIVRKIFWNSEDFLTRRPCKSEQFAFLNLTQRKIICLVLMLISKFYEFKVNWENRIQSEGIQCVLINLFDQKSMISKLNKKIYLNSIKLMGQECCQVTTDDSILINKTLLILQKYFQSLDQFDIIDPFLQSKIHNLKQLNFFKNSLHNQYFIGTWNQGKAQGLATLYTPSQLFYQGNFLNGLPQGEGEMIFLSKNQSYKGQFLNGMAHGPGLYKNNLKKISFQGEWNNSNPQKGLLIFQDNTNIKKIQLQDFKTGKAHIYYKDFRQYHGCINVQLFIPEGEGQLRTTDQSSYKGSWKDGLMHGYGIYSWKDGSKYEGNYVNGKKYGEGVFFYPSGKRYVGMWSNGKQQGYGKIITKDGQIQKDGIWKNGLFQKNVPKAQKELQK